MRGLFVHRYWYLMIGSDGNCQTYYNILDMSDKPELPKLKPQVKVHYDLLWHGRPIGIITDREEFIKMFREIAGIDLEWEDVCTTTP